VIGFSQDGNREWITILATICADGTAIPPAIIFAGSGSLQSTWVEDVELGQHQAAFASSPNGWTSDILGLAWLQQVFDKHTKAKAGYGRQYRLLFVDGHGSHINMGFLDWCEKHRILVAVYLPHSTHRLQPLDVSLFSPLATAYTEQLDNFIYQTQNLCSLGKRDFFSLFWPAYNTAFSLSNITPGWCKTGLYPLDSEVVLGKLKKQVPPPEVRPISNHSSGSSALSAPEWRKIEQLVKCAVSESVNEADNKKVKGLNNTLQHLSTQIAVLKAENTGLKAAIYHEKKRRKRGKKLVEEFRAQEGGGGIFFTPQKIQAMRELEAQREVAKESEQAQKQLVKEQQQQAKLARQQEALQRKQQREDNKQRKLIALDVAKAQKEQAKDTLNADKQLNNEYQASVKKPKRQKQANIAPLAGPILNIITSPAEVPKQPSQRSGRIVRRPRHLDGYQIDI
jgi:hypothetical protein